MSTKTVSIALILVVALGVLALVHLGGGLGPSPRPTDGGTPTARGSDPAAAAAGGEGQPVRRPAPPPAADPGQFVAGRVVDEEGEGVEDASLWVWVTPSATGSGIGNDHFKHTVFVRTDSAGRWQYTAPPEDSRMQERPLSSLRMPAAWKRVRVYCRETCICPKSGRRWRH